MSLCRDSLYVIILVKVPRWWSWDSHLLLQSAVSFWGRCLLIYFSPHCRLYFLLLYVPNNFRLGTRHCDFYLIGCVVFLYSFKYSWTFSWDTNSLEIIWYFWGFSLSFIGWEQSILQLQVNSSLVQTIFSWVLCLVPLYSEVFHSGWWEQTVPNQVWTLVMVLLSPSW